MTLLPFKPPPPGAEEHAHAETERKNALFAWADDLLAQLGVAKRIADATSFDELNKIMFDVDAVDVVLAIRDALHPAHGSRADFLAGMEEGTLKRLIRMRFEKMKKERRDELLGGPAASAGGKQSSNYNWAND
jgi:hypothetical protein